MTGCQIFCEKAMKKLTVEDEISLKRQFLSYLGERIKTKRNRKNISQTTLAECLHISTSALSKYESGNRDMPVSYLPLISTYCDFSITDYFEKDVAKRLSDTFSDLVEITAKKYDRRAYSIITAPEKILKGKIFETRGVEIIEYIDGTEKPLSQKQKLLSGDVDLQNVTPFTEEEFIEYIKEKEDGKYLAILDAAQRFLAYIGDEPQRETIKCTIAEFVIKEMVIENLSSGDIPAKQAYAYYKNKMQEYRKISSTNGTEEPEDLL